MPALECPHCGCYANFRHRWSREIPEGWKFDIPPTSGCYTCDNCEYPIAVMHRGVSSIIEQYWPTKTGRKEFPDVPESIAAIASQAHICLAAGAPHGAVALARAVVESVAKAKGVVTGSLQAKIDRLCNDGHISEAMKEAAHEIRFAGNAAAHGDLVAEPLAIEDAREVVSLMDAILERVYQEPAQVERIRKQREARQRKSSSQDTVAADEPPF